MKLDLYTEVCFNSKELEIANSLGLVDLFGSYAFVIENCRKKERNNLNINFPNLVQEDIAEVKNKYPNKNVLGIIQFKKGITKTDEQIRNAINCGVFEGSDGVCFYETNPLQNLEGLEKDYSKFIDLAEDYKKYFVIEMDGEDVLKKINFLL